MKRRRQNLSDQPTESSSAGSPMPGGPVFLAVGKLRRSHGVKGEIIMDVLTGFPERLRPGKLVFAGDDHEPLQITGVRGHDKSMIIRFAGIDTPEAVSRLRNMTVFVSAEGLPDLPDGEYYHHQLLGLSIVDEAGQLLGELVNIIETGANDVYMVKTPDGKELLLPAVEDVVLEVNLDQGQMRVRPPEWQ